jgi:hypothetical protein
VTLLDAGAPPSASLPALVADDVEPPTPGRRRRALAGWASRRSSRVISAVVAVALFAGLCTLPGGRPADADWYDGTTIMGPSMLTPAQIATWFRQTSTQDYVVSVSIDELARTFVEEGLAEGVRGDIAFAQAIIETGWFAHVPDNNFAGIGWCNSCTDGFGFATPRDGVRAQIQHLRNFADPTVTSATLAHEPWSSRFDSFGLRGVAPRWEDLNGRWAVPGDTYAQTILGVYGQMAAHAGVGPDCPVIQSHQGVPTAPGWSAMGDGTVVASRTTELGAFPGGAVVTELLTTGTGAGAWEIRTDGTVTPLGDAPDVGSLPVPPATPVVDGARSATGGLWVVTEAGVVTALGGAAEMPALDTPVEGTVVGIAGTPTGAGYWLVTDLGAVYAFGDAPFVGSHPQLADPAAATPIVGLLPTASGQGYWLADSAGRVVNLGDALWFGDLTGCGNRPVLDIQPDPNGNGYWLVSHEAIYSLGYSQRSGWLLDLIFRDDFTPAWA